jgi:hypothetical protein
MCKTPARTIKLIKKEAFLGISHRQTGGGLPNCTATVPEVLGRGAAIENAEL